jgi:hypothetical protein
MHASKSDWHLLAQRERHSASLSANARPAKAAERKVPICSEVNRVFLAFTFFLLSFWRWSYGLGDPDSLGGERAHLLDDLAPGAHEPAERMDELSRQVAPLGLGQGLREILHHREAWLVRRRQGEVEGAPDIVGPVCRFALVPLQASRELPGPHPALQASLLGQHRLEVLDRS